MDQESLSFFRPRRLRQNAYFRDLIAETHLKTSQLILPLFVREDIDCKEAIPSMPHHFQLPLKELSTEIDEILSLNLRHILLFTIPAKKDSFGFSAYTENNLAQRAISSIKEKAPHLNLIADCCLCSFTDHGHCGRVDEKGEVDNDATLPLLAKTAVHLARSGADCIAPSSMMDGQVRTIRQALDRAGFSQIPILSYAAKYASSLYGPFRQAAACAPLFGNRRTYQMDVRNAREALKEVFLDLEEGADMIMVKPAHTYLDIIYRVKERFPEVPLAAYHTSGEYALLHGAAEQGAGTFSDLLFETLFAIKRAGADCIISYGSKIFAAAMN
jgi:porphobilinogen synthase